LLQKRCERLAECRGERPERKRKTNMRKLLCLLVLAGVALIGTPAVLHANTITGGVSFSSTGTGTMTWDTTTLTFTGTNNGRVVSTSGNFVTATPLATLATFYTFQFNPLNPSPVTVWQISSNTYFSLGTVTSYDLSNPASITVNGNGTIYVSGYDATSASYVFTGNTGGGTFSFSATNVATPEPASFLLLGTGFAGLLGLWRRKW
jgi:hypothetical protein